LLLLSTSKTVVPLLDLDTAQMEPSRRSLINSAIGIDNAVEGQICRLVLVVVVTVGGIGLPEQRMLGAAYNAVLSDHVQIEAHAEHTDLGP